jgi:RND family efflux transporter MFP subunit
MASSLREELASLKIDRRKEEFGSGRKRRTGRKASSGGGFGLRILSLLIWIIPISLLSLGGGYAYKQYQEIRSKPVVTVGKVQSMTSGEAEKLLSAKGYLKSRAQSTIGAKVAGRVQELFVEEGSRVKKGQILAILEHNDLDAQLESRRATLLRGLADIEEARADLEYKRSKADRARRLQNKNMSVSAEEMQQSTSSVDMGAAHLASLEATVKFQQAQVREVEESLANMRIVAPFDGTVVERPADLGEMISGGTVLTLANLEQMEVETDVAENLLSRIAIGQPAEVSVSAVPSKHYRGRLRQVIPISDRARGTVKVKVEILDPDDNLFPELVATVHFLPDKAHQGLDVGNSHLFLPKSALFEEGGHSHVWVVDDKEAIRKTRVEVVVTNDDLARVESGLKAGETVVLNPTQALHGGEVVKVGD